MLLDGKNKSRVMLSTPIKNVALHVDPLSSPHEIGLLNDDEGWELFLKGISLEGDTSTACHSESDETGRKILAKCGGLPLASYFSLGRSLSSKDRRT